MLSKFIWRRRRPVVELWRQSDSRLGRALEQATGSPCCCCCCRWCCCCCCCCCCCHITEITRHQLKPGQSQAALRVAGKYEWMWEYKSRQGGPGPGTEAADSSCGAFFFFSTPPPGLRLSCRGGWWVRCTICKGGAETLFVSICSVLAQASFNKGFHQARFCQNKANLTFQNISQT